jgi:hypothetical protein
MADDDLIKPSPEVMQCTKHAKEAHGLLRKSAEHWLIIGEAIDAFRKQLIETLRPNDIDKPGQRYKDSMGAYLRANGFHETCDNGFTKAERINLQHWIDNRAAIENYRATLDLKTRRQQNNPNAVWRGFCQMLDQNSGGNKPKPKPKKNKPKPRQTDLKSALAKSKPQEITAAIIDAKNDATKSYGSGSEQVVEVLQGLLDYFNYGSLGELLDDRDDANRIIELEAENEKLKNNKTTSPEAPALPDIQPVGLPEVPPSAPPSERHAALLTTLDLAVHPETTTAETIAAINGYRNLGRGTLPSAIWGARKPRRRNPDDERTQDEKVEDSIRHTEDIVEEMQRRMDDNARAWNEMNEDYAELEIRCRTAESECDFWRKRCEHLEAQQRAEAAE